MFLEAGESLRIEGGTSLVQSGGQIEVDNSQFLADNSSMELIAGQLTVGDNLSVGSGSTFDMHSGDVSIGGYMSIGSDSSVTAGGGQIGVARDVYVYGTLDIDSDMAVGRSVNVGPNGTVQLSSGSLIVDVDTVLGSYSGPGTMIQTGGIHTVQSALRLGVRGNPSYDPAEGAYHLYGGRLEVSDLLLSRGQYSWEDPDKGSLIIHSAESEVEIRNLLHFGEDSEFSAVPGTKIHMAGASLQNESITPTSLSGLDNTMLLFTGGDTNSTLLEAAGRDVGATWSGFEDNFAMEGLHLGTDSSPGFLRLTDSFDNQVDWEGSEALYVEQLVVEGDSVLDLAGLNLYYFDYFDLGGTVEVNGGQLTQAFRMGDLSTDGIVDIIDLNILLINWGRQVPPGDSESGDTNGDGLVDIIDLNAVLIDWGKGVPPG